MKMLFIYLALFVGQMNTLRDKPVVHPQPQCNLAKVQFGGKLLTLVNAPGAVDLPTVPPMAVSQKVPWFVYAKNLDPGAVTVLGKVQSSFQVKVNQTVNIHSNGTGIP
jgi:hypothetical protein